MRFSHRLICYTSAIVSPLLLFSAFALFAYRQPIAILFGVVFGYAIMMVLPSLLGCDEDQASGGWLQFSIFAAMLVILRTPAIQERVNRPILEADLTGWMSLGIAGLVAGILICIGGSSARRDGRKFR
jgi:hypothetical protein